MCIQCRWRRQTIYSAGMLRMLDVGMGCNLYANIFAEWIVKKKKTQLIMVRCIGADNDGDDDEGCRSVASLMQKRINVLFIYGD